MTEKLMIYYPGNKYSAVRAGFFMKPMSKQGVGLLGGIEGGSLSSGKGKPRSGRGNQVCRNNS
jgi:hypothetical protein